MTETIKSQVLKALKNDLQKKVDSSSLEIASIRESRNSDTKSSAGDKFETGRAMAQMELEKMERALSRSAKLLQDLELINLEKHYKQVEFGSLIITNKENYFASFGLGKVTVDSKDYYAISLASPIGQVIRQKRVGDKLVFQGREICIENIL
ncbi:MULTISPECIES: 3-oxoacyl-ACP synthase [unclassified Lentimicrobium]|uniref:3-oxoacyl-ACP synthase n=1 Tax=unclassified Lentimicrobium TaxID=2677434 RepID=UPI0015566640|nr:MULTISPECIES: 3-oxoacyl-ACP synthase [unclassified Lentimicrobium]NPD45075.1 3-oxoacyl-ACP synthase [Lentimicrobium sp. S6]NPD84527.1 3-oxoacyl-ACP synthase [Lentimicrobium sp. L6]